MSRQTTKLLKAALAAVHYSGADSLLAPLTQGAGVIFMLHQVSPDEPQEFEPNRILKVTPDFLEEVVRAMREADFDLIGLDEIPTRLMEDSERPFACFTLDDGYRDNREHAYPVFKRHDAPFTIYVATDFADGRADLWWLKLERLLRAAANVTLPINGEVRDFPLGTAAEKEAAFDEIYWWLRSIPEDLARSTVEELGTSLNIDTADLSSELLMTWDEIRDLAADPLVTIGAHTRSHLALAKLPETRARAEMVESVVRIEKELGRPCRNFAYPYGCMSSAGPREFRIAREIGLKTAVTTQKGLIYKEHLHELTSLPRLSLNGDFQDIRYVKALVSGVPFAMLNAFQRISGYRKSA